jgi:toxin ParE1/3/4
MAGRSLEIHPEALEEFKSALIWYQERSEIAAANFVAELDRAVELVIKSPERWPSGEYGIRKFTLRRFPFAIFYRTTGAAIQILAVAHGHRRPGYWKPRASER